MKIIVKSIEHQGILSDDAFEWLKDHLGEELQLLSISWYADGYVCACGGELSHIAISTSAHNDKGELISLLPSGDFCLCLFGSNNAKFELIGAEELSCIDTI